MKLDSIDLRILATLQREGRITKLRLAHEVGLSASPCWERMRRLETAGFIAGYRAEIRLAPEVAVTTVFVEVTLDSHHADDFRRFEAHLATVPEVVEAHAVGGGCDYMLKVVTPDLSRYQALVEGLLAADIGIGRYFTYVVTKPVKPYAGLPLDALVPQTD